MKFYTESSPHIRHNDTTDKIMIRVIIALMPSIIYSIILFGYRVVILYLASILSCLLSSFIVKKMRHKPIHFDYPAVVTALLMVMTLPPTATVTMVVIGSVVAIVFTREVFGGLGFNVFNPALVGRAFLQTAFPAQMTMYIPPKNLPFNKFFITDLHHSLNAITGGTQTIDMMDALTSSTPLTFMEYIWNPNISKSIFKQIFFESHYYMQMLFGNTAGAIGETSFFLILLGGIFLIITNTIDWRIPLGMFISLVITNLFIYFFTPVLVASPIYNILAGGFALGAFFMATDMVTCPSAPKGVWIYSLLIGSVLATLRAFGSSPEYMMYSILIGNMFMPLIVMLTRPLPFGKKEFLNIKKAEAKSQGGSN